MATMVDVARIAGVSISTVSHVLNGTRNVEKGTRRRVLSAIEQTGYRQDTLARAMRRSKTDSIGPSDRTIAATRTSSHTRRVVDRAFMASRSHPVPSIRCQPEPGALR